MVGQLTQAKFTFRYVLKLNIFQV